MGVAGSGKSTLARQLCGGDAEYTLGEFIHTRNPGHLMLVGRSLPRLAPILAANVFRRPRISWADFKLLVYVTQWHRLLGRGPASAVTLLDQGPLYALVRLRAQGRGVEESRYFKQWWNEMAGSWATRLSGIVWLDAPDDVLRSRIDDRSQAHALKGESTGASRRFIGRYRTLFEEVLDLVERNGGPEPHRFETAVTPPDVLAAEVRSLLAANRMPSS